MHSSVHSASSHTGSVQITINLVLDVKFQSLGFIQSQTYQISSTGSWF